MEDRVFLKKQMHALIIVGIPSETKFGEQMYNVVLADVQPDVYNGRPTGCYKWITSKAQISKSNIIREIMIRKDTDKKVEGFNFRVENGEIKGNPASLERFKSEPVVILSQILNQNDNVIAYRCALANGELKAIKVEKLLEYCERKEKAEKIPIQNAVYVPATPDKVAHIKSYAGTEFYCEYSADRSSLIKAREEQTKQVITEAKKREKEISPLDIYTPEQITEIKLMKQNEKNAFPAWIGDPKLSAEQMRALRIGANKGIDIRHVAKPEYEVRCINLFILEAENNNNLVGVITPEHSFNQLSFIAYALQFGLDVERIINKELSLDFIEDEVNRMQQHIYSETNTPGKKFKAEDIDV